jgi:hypothetical protein
MYVSQTSLQFLSLSPNIPLTICFINSLKLRLLFGEQTMFYTLTKGEAKLGFHKSIIFKKKKDDLNVAVFLRI